MQIDGKIINGNKIVSKMKNEYSGLAL